MLPETFGPYPGFLKGTKMSSEDVGTGLEKLQLDLKDLCSEWDNTPSVRQWLRQDGAVLFAEGTTESVKAASKPHIAGFLTPLLMRMASTDGAPQPLVEPLRDQIHQLYRLQSKESDGDQVVNDSWSTRKFLGFVKMKTRLEKPSKVSRLMTVETTPISFEKTVSSYNTRIHETNHGHHFRQRPVTCIYMV